MKYLRVPFSFCRDPLQGEHAWIHILVLVVCRQAVRTKESETVRTATAVFMSLMSVAQRWYDRGKLVDHL